MKLTCYQLHNKMKSQSVRTCCPMWMSHKSESTRSTFQPTELFLPRYEHLYQLELLANHQQLKARRWACGMHMVECQSAGRRWPDTAMLGRLVAYQCRKCQRGIPPVAEIFNIAWTTSQHHLNICVNVGRTLWWKNVQLCTNVVWALQNYLTSCMPTTLLHYYKNTLRINCSISHFKNKIEIHYTMSFQNSNRQHCSNVIPLGFWGKGWLPRWPPKQKNTNISASVWHTVMVQVVL